ncbi:MAG TPA: MarR family winged helix-turn-helix transcriptional regulator [Sulfuriferula sp.]|nr:MarR family winged helix-turn-helix transcriptional regulator [Sulfuriferula sp.]
MKNIESHQDEPSNQGVSIPARKPRTAQVKDVLMLFRVIFGSVQKHSAWVEKQCQVSGAQLWAMWELLVSPGLRVGDLSKALTIHQSTASNLVDKLEKRGLLRRERGGPDQRVVRLYLTPAGLEVVNRAPRPAQGVLMEALNSLPDEILEGLGNNLTNLVGVLDIKDKNAGMEPLAEE